MYFSPQQVFSAFERLSPRNPGGKTHLERTSILMYFFSFDAACKKAGTTKLDLNPEKVHGQNNRKAMELEFTKFVLIDQINGKVRQVMKLGSVDGVSQRPDKRISSNFLTVPLKKASQQSEPFYYPRRPPSAPLMILGPSTGLKWGIGHHPDWPSNLPKYISDIKQSTPFTDLCIFLTRNFEFSEYCTNYTQAINSALDSIFSEKLSEFLKTRVQQEKVLTNHIRDPFSEKYEVFSKQNPQLNDLALSDLSKEKLIKRVKYLEAVLNKKNIRFETSK